MGPDGTVFGDEPGEGWPNLHKCTYLELLDYKHIVEGPTVVQNRLTSLRRVYAPLISKTKLKPKMRREFFSFGWGGGVIKV